MSGRDDERLDRELRKVLRRRDPGDASSALRTWVLDVPEDDARSQVQQHRPRAAVLGLAAVILLAVIGLTTLRHFGPPGVVGSSVASGSVATPSAVESPVGAFDPTLEGPGVSSTDDLSPAILVVLACAVLGFLAFTVRGRRRLIPAVVAVLLAAWGIAASLVPVTILDSGTGWASTRSRRRGFRVPRRSCSTSWLRQTAASASGSISRLRGQFQCESKGSCRPSSAGIPARSPACC